MDSNITRRDIDKYRECLKHFKPYEENATILTMFDGKCDANRMKATTAKRILEHYGIDPYDDNDYGSVEE